MPIQALTQQTFQTVVAGSQIVFVDFWASWCGWCTRFKPIYEESSHLHPDIVYGTVDTEAEQQLAAVAQITSLPTLVAFREGLPVYSKPGFQTAGQLEDVVQQIMWLDMDEVRRELAKENSEFAENATAPSNGAAQMRAAGPAAGPVRYGWPGLRVP